MPAVTHEHLQVLVELQSWDKVIDKHNKRADAIPDEIESLERRIEEEQAKAEELRTESKRLQKEHKEKEIDLSDREESIKKHQNELNQVKSNDAFKALQKEIDDAKAKKETLETEILELLEKIDAAVEAEKHDVKELEADIAEIRKTIEGKKAEAEKERAEALLKGADRGKIAERVPPEILKKYEAIRPRAKGVAVVPLKKDICGGCNMKLNSQVLMDVAKGKELVLCEGCQRILYHE